MKKVKKIGEGSINPLLDKLKEKGYSIIVGGVVWERTKKWSEWSVKDVPYEAWELEDGRIAVQKVGTENRKPFIILDRPKN